MAKNLFNRILRREKEEKKPGKIETEGDAITKLEDICSGDKEVYEALQHTMFLDPRKITATLDQAAENASDFEKKKDEVKAKMWYHIAGGLALWKGDASKVKQFFNKCAILAPDTGYELITKIPEKAVEKAQEYYKTLSK
jgi:hypothetical protein